MKVFLNGRTLPEERARISIHDRGFLCGDGVYETLRVYDGKPFLLHQHLDRLLTSLAKIKLRLPWSMKKIGEATVNVIRINRHREAAVRITVSRGPGPQGFDPRACKNPTILITSRPFSGYRSELYRTGMRVFVSSVRRNSPLALPPSIKSTSCINNILAKIEAVDRGMDEAVLLGDDGAVTEGTISNIFAVKRDRLLTPALNGGLLPGVTRAHVCRLARGEGLRVIETKLRPRDLLTADELFLTSSLMEIMPIGHFGRRKMKVGPITRRLMICYTRPRLK